MALLEDVLSDLKARKASLSASSKEIAADKAKATIQATLNTLISKIESLKLVAEKQRLEKLKDSMKKFSTDVDTYNGNRRSLINAFNSLKTACKGVKGDTKNGDFAKLASDAEDYVGLNNLEKT